MKKRKILDSMMALLMVFLSASELNAGSMEMMLHEYGGIILFACFFLHMLWNRKWFTGIFKKDGSPRKMISAIVNLSLIVMMILVMVSSLFVSRTVFPFLHLRGAFMAKRLHLSATAWLILLSAFHLGFHRSHFKVSVLWIVPILAGAVAFVIERYWERLFFLNDFAYAPDISGILLYLFGFLIFMTFSLLGSLISIITVQRNNQ